MRPAVRRPKTFKSDPLSRKAFPLGFGPLTGLIPSQDRPLRPFGGPGPPTEAPRAAQDRQQRPQERPKTANIGPKSGPRPPTYAPRAAQDRLQRPVNFTIDHQSKM